MSTPSDVKHSYSAVAIILAISAALSVFLIWLIYFKTPVPLSQGTGFVKYLPAVNASLNALSGMCLVLGYVAIRRKRPQVHKRFMVAALVCSALFLCSYLVYHHFQGDTPFTGTGLIRPVYFFVLISHIVLSIVVLPLVLLTVFRALRSHFEQHRKIARYTFPLWLYVSVTGVLVFVMLHLFNHT